MSADFLGIHKRADMDQLIARAAATSYVGHVELLRAARDGVINLAFLDRHADAPMKVLERAARPVVVVVGDDDYHSAGPSNWSAWKRLKYWAKAALVHASGADAGSYELAVAMALIQPRMLLIETDSEHAHQWGDALCKCGIKTVGLLPRNGAHPVSPAKGDIQ